MAWDKDLSEEQKVAACHFGGHARLLAGPGTGKTLTLTRRVCYLIQECGVLPEEILIISFSRATTADLRSLISEALKMEKTPVASTLHAFALTELIKNSFHVTALPQPIRIADDWEVKNIITKDLDLLLKGSKGKRAKDLLEQLGTDWQSLNADELGWEKRFPNPKFFGAWEEHRKIYGYTLLSELVYQLKKTIEQSRDAKIAENIRYLIVDEYQDLNKCDLDVIKKIADNGVEVYVAGDDDQCIYEFRGAHPIGIREFAGDYTTAKNYILEICMRCGRKILEIANFVAGQDHRREKKVLRSTSNMKEGKVKILNFLNENLEAKGVAAICKYLIENTSLDPGEILILLHSDSNGRYSKPIRAELENSEIPVASPPSSLLNDKDVRIAFSFFKLYFQSEDSLIWRTILKLWHKNVGDKSIEAVYNVAREKGITFYRALMAAKDNPDWFDSNYISRLINGINDISEQSEIFSANKMNSTFESPTKFTMALETILHSLFGEADSFEFVYSIFASIIFENHLMSLNDLIKFIEEKSLDPEKVVDKEKVNILSMHKAKGLNSEVVIIIGAEDEHIPANSVGAQFDEMRRLLYVSLTRAKSSLFITFCNKRFGSQSYSRKGTKNPNKTLTQFLRGWMYAPESGENYVLELQNK